MRALAVLAATGILVGAVALSGGGAGAAGSTVVPVADAYVRADQADANFGGAGVIDLGRRPATNGYLRFNVSIPTGESVTRATLKLFATQNRSSGFTVHRVDDTGWDEAAINYANAPPIGAQVAASGSYAKNAYVSVDVTALATGSGLVSLALKRDAKATNTFNSREAASNPPQLIVETAPSTPAGTLVYALGDGADGGTASSELASYIKAQSPDRFFYLGDVYETGTATEFTNNYEPLYGSLAPKTDPVIGNHESANRSTGYGQYWQSKRGWSAEQAQHRSYVDASGWQVIAYSSEESDMGAEGNWVAGEVAKHLGTCRIVMAHKGRHVVTDTSHDDNTSQDPVWAQIAGRTAINLVGHNHIYGRLAPLDGVNVFVSGAGGHGLRSLGAQHHPVAASKTGVPTATRLVLRPGAADFQQVDKGGTVYDSGTIGCTPAS